MTKTIRERAEHLKCRYGHSEPCVCAERVLRELVEEIATSVPGCETPIPCGEQIRKTYLAPRSPEEVVQKATSDALGLNTSSKYDMTGVARDIVKALREEGMLKG